jgi:hypothetical protein
MVDFEMRKMLFTLAVRLVRPVRRRWSASKVSKREVRYVRWQYIIDPDLVILRRFATRFSVCTLTFKCFAVLLRRFLAIRQSGAQ